MALIPGTRLGSHEIVAPIGAGGMGEVYKAKDSLPGWGAVGDLVKIKLFGEGSAGRPGSLITSFIETISVIDSEGPLPETSESMWTSRHRWLWKRTPSIGSA